MNLRFTPQAHADLLEIRRYVSSELHNETAAQRIARAILSSCSNLKCFPQMGIALSEKINVQTAIRYIVSEKHPVRIGGNHSRLFLYPETVWLCLRGLSEASLRRDFLPPLRRGRKLTSGSFQHSGSRTPAAG